MLAVLKDAKYSKYVWHAKHKRRHQFRRTKMIGATARLL